MANCTHLCLKDCPHYCVQKCLQNHKNVPAKISTKMLTKCPSKISKKDHKCLQKCPHMPARMSTIVPIKMPAKQPKNCPQKWTQNSLWYCRPNFSWNCRKKCLYEAPEVRSTIGPKYIKSYDSKTKYNMVPFQVVSYFFQIGSFIIYFSVWLCQPVGSQ